MKFTKYDTHGAYHWNKYLYEPESIYSRHVKFIANWIEEKIILDLGCGDGLITWVLRQKGKIVTGIDNNQTAINLCKMKKVDEVYLCDAEEICFPDNSIHAIFAGDIIEHLEDQDTVMKEIKRVLISGGMLYITTPPLDLPHNNDFHTREFTAEDLTKYIESFKFKLQEPIITQFVRLYAKFKLEES
jgi:ubiquinone/menaquinone biosynthesis C-methylase UbiE